MTLLVNLAHSAAHSRANGPGVRAVLWVQGCSLHCRGCHNPHTWAAEARQVVTVEALRDWFDRLEGVRGLTLSGGEPFEQALALAELCRSVRARGADVVAFSGFTREQLEAGVRPHAQDLLAQTDLLVDGPFRATEPTAAPLRGSANQRLHFLGDRIRPAELEGLPRAEWLGDGAGGVVTGFGLQRMMRALQLARAPAR